MASSIPFSRKVVARTEAGCGYIRWSGSGVPFGFSAASLAIPSLVVSTGPCPLGFQCGFHCVFDLLGRRGPCFHGGVVIGGHDDVDGFRLASAARCGGDGDEGEDDDYNGSQGWPVPSPVGCEWEQALFAPGLPLKIFSPLPWGRAFNFVVFGVPAFGGFLWLGRRSPPQRRKARLVPGPLVVSSAGWLPSWSRAAFGSWW